MALQAQKSTLTVVALVLASACGAAPKEVRAMDAPRSVVVAVDFAHLVERLLPGYTLGARSLTPGGVNHRFISLRNKQHFGSDVAVHASAEEAHAAIERDIKFVSVGPNERAALGDESFLWRTRASPAGGRIKFRRANVTLTLDDLPFDERLQLAQRIDAALRDGAPEVERGGSVPVPRFARPELPDVIHAGATVSAPLVLEGAPPELVLLDSESPSVVVTGGPAPMVTFYAPREEGQQSLVVLAATAGNVLGRGVFPVTIVR
jgi:hypothetical protein